MKYIKLFEEINNDKKYKKGDYVVVKQYGKGVIKGIIVFIGKGITIRTIPTYKDNENTFYVVMTKDIIRKMTDDEIDEYKLMMKIKKYNI